MILQHVLFKIKPHLFNEPNRVIKYYYINAYLFSRSCEEIFEIITPLSPTWFFVSKMMGHKGHYDGTKNTKCYTVVK
jgi:hypothetical protein